MIIQSQVLCEEFARPPEFPKEVQDIFFDDAHEALSGSPPSRDEVVEATPERSQVDQTAAWNQIVDADTLTSEVKRIANRLATMIGKPGQFKLATHEVCRRELTMLAVLFHVIREYPDALRWKSSASAMEQSCLSAADTCSQGSEESLAAVRELVTQLEELLSGQPVSASGPSGNDRISEFALLMQRMESATEELFPALLAQRSQFRKHTQDVIHEAEILAMLSQFIRREEYGYADDDAYQGHADQLRDAAAQLNEAAADRNFAKAVKAAAALSQACANCHAAYRG